jgi:hypothetical protein
MLMKSRWFSKNMLIRRYFLQKQVRPLPATIVHIS